MIHTTPEIHNNNDLSINYNLSFNSSNENKISKARSSEERIIMLGRTKEEWKKIIAED